MPLRNGALICYTNKATATVLISDADWPFPSFLYQDHLYALPTSPSDITAKLNQALARVESLERHIRNAKDRERKAKSIVHALLEDLRQKTLINEELKERLDLCSGEYSTFFDQWADLCRSFDCGFAWRQGSGDSCGCDADNQDICLFVHPHFNTSSSLVMFLDNMICK